MGSAAAQRRRWSTAGAVVGLVLGVASLASCRGETKTTEPDVAPAAAATPAPIEEPVELAVPTYDGSGQSVHPDVSEFPQTWNGYRFWFVLTPYPRSDERLENPSIFVSRDGLGLAEPVRGRNPVVAAPPGKDSYNSDPELVYDEPYHRLLLFYREVKGGRNSVRVVGTADGRNWTSPRVAFWGRSHDVVSPTIAPQTPRGPALAWAVAAGRAGCNARATRVVVRRAADSSRSLADAAWSTPQTVDLAQPGYNVWHIKVRYIPSRDEYWALYSAYPRSGSDCQSDDLFFARSSDGVRWQTYRRPLLRHGVNWWTSLAIYRSSFLYDPASNVLRVWFSSRSAHDHWHVGFARFDVPSMLAQLARPDGAPARPRAPSRPIEPRPAGRTPPAP